MMIDNNAMETRIRIETYYTWQGKREPEYVTVYIGNENVTVFHDWITNMTDIECFAIVWNICDNSVRFWSWDISSLMLFSFERYNLLFWYYMCFKFYLKIYHINFIMRIFIVIDNLKNLILSMVRMIFSQISTSISIDLIHKINWIQYLSLHWRVIHCHI